MSQQQQRLGAAPRLFLSNIAYDVPEAQIRELCRGVGPVEHFHMPFDRETGRHKGMAFCDYVDTVYGSAAIRQLSGHLISGRALRIDYADLPRRNHQMASVLKAGDAPRAYTSTDLQWLAESLDHTTHEALVGEVRLAAQQHPDELLRLLEARPEVVQALAHILYISDTTLWPVAKTREISDQGPAPARSPTTHQHMDISQQQCVVCRRPAIHPVSPPCRHVCCTDCLFGMGRATCPACQAPFEWDRMFPPKSPAPSLSSPVSFPFPIDLTPEEHAKLARLRALTEAEVEQLPLPVREQVRLLRAYH